MPANSQFSTVLHKRSSVAGMVPALTSLSAGELAMNIHDGKLFIKTVGEQIKTFSNDNQSAFTLNPILSGVEPQYGGNTIAQVFANVLGGYNNDVSGAGSTTVNGEDNDIAGDFAFIGSGLKNQITASGDYSAILGGQNNLISHQNSFTIGSNLSSHAENFTYINNLSAQGFIYGNNLTVTNTVSAKYYQGTLLDWMTLVRGYKTVPTLLQTIAGGDVYTYVFATTGTDRTYFRYIANDGSEDSFYGNFTSGTLSNLIARKAIIL